MKSIIRAVVLLTLLLPMQVYSAEDKLKLDGTSIIGNSEMPNVLYIVPWKKTPEPNLNPELHESLIDVQLTPIDRQVFLKRIEHHQRYK